MPTFLKKRGIFRQKPRKKNKLLSVLFAFILVLMFFLLIINLSDIFSSLITNKSSLFYARKLEIPSYTIYGLSIKDFDNESEAQSYSFLLKTAGAAGVIYVHGEYYVLASAYESLIEAQEVKQNLINDNYDAKIINLKVLPVSRLYKGSNQKKYEDSISFFKDCFKDLYEISLNFDKNEKSKNNVLSVVAKNLTLNQEHINLLKDIKESEELKNKILEKLLESKVLLEELLLCEKTELEFSSKIKESYIKIVDANARLNKNLADIEN